MDGGEGIYLVMMMVMMVMVMMMMMMMKMMIFMILIDADIISFPTSSIVSDQNPLFYASRTSKPPS
jgi:hypothetical protein